MSLVLDDAVESFLAAANPDPSPLLDEMAAHGDARDFPTVGPDAGQFLRFVATVARADRIFEFGSGFGYSAAWFLGALPDDGEIVLTDYDSENLAEAREFLARVDGDTEIHYEAGDAFDAFESHDGPFDVVFLDHDKERYAEAFDRVVADLAPGGVVVADNMMAGPVETEDVTAALAGDDPANDATAGVAEYVERVRDHPDFETSFVPLGEGLAVSTRKRTAGE
ncbi:O-methyltransferase [Halobacterium litoreum]|uniref:O-methyltransferase n=1 Tax=Halobacterium litoreum TaxID=2039234 RepID=A0ABD5NHY1_9EURY|nr:O-methyltransferase [Halobacterium litoreum]UHH12307.1 O-methyltransferase [Halobacterium litoreum]